MPSLRELFCLSRHKYSSTSHDDQSHRRRRQHKRKESQDVDQTDFGYYSEPDYSFHQRVGSYSRESVPRFLDDGQLKPKPDPLAVISGRKDQEKGRWFSNWNKKSTEGSSCQKKRLQYPRGPVVQESSRQYEESKRSLDNEVKRLHVQDIFHSNSQRHAQTLNSDSDPKTAIYDLFRGNHNRQREDYATPRRSESMFQYIPKSLNDSAVSAALFGNRLDDFVHDPGWNRAFNRFASSPTTDSSLSFNEQNGHSHNQPLSSPSRRLSILQDPLEIIQTTLSGFGDGSPIIQSGLSGFCDGLPVERIETKSLPPSDFIISSNLTISSGNSHVHDASHISNGGYNWTFPSSEEEDGEEEEEFMDDESYSNLSQGIDVEKLFHSAGDVLY